VIASGIVTFTTDFGHGSSFVGQMKGAALAVSPDLQLIDLCHEVPAQRIATGAYLLETGYAAFPPGTTHVAVVDPGVGTSRDAIALRAGDFYFLAPDNGLVSRVLDREPLHEAYLIRSEQYLRQPRSSTFEGRDLFAPAAAWIAGGLELNRLGPVAGKLVRLPRCKLTLQPGYPEELPLLHVDNFGNIVLDVRLDELRTALGGEPGQGRAFSIDTPGRRVDTFHATYGEAPAGEPFLLINSAGYLELAVRNGRADEALDLRLDMEVLLTVSP
jgi:S-adenosylmethionine hydrolase